MYKLLTLNSFFPRIPHSLFLSLSLQHPLTHRLPWANDVYHDSSASKCNIVIKQRKIRPCTREGVKCLKRSTATATATTRRQQSTTVSPAQCTFCPVWRHRWRRKAKVSNLHPIAEWKSWSFTSPDSQIRRKGKEQQPVSSSHTHCELSNSHSAKTNRLCNRSTLLKRKKKTRHIHLRLNLQFSFVNLCIITYYL